MSFRERMKKEKKGLNKRHNRPPSKFGNYPTIFKKNKIPEGVSFFTSKEGDHLVDIIPFRAGPNMPLDLDTEQPITPKGKLDYVLDISVHMNIGPKKAPFVCPERNFNEPCPICEFIVSNRMDKEEWAKIAPKHRVIYLVWVHDSREEEKKGIQIFHASWHLMEEKIAAIAQKPKAGGTIRFSDYDDGKSIAWKRKGKKRDTDYIGHRLVDRERPIPDGLLNLSFSLDSVVKMRPSYEAIQKAFNGMGMADEDEPVTKGKKKKKNKKKKNKTSRRDRNSQIGRKPKKRSSSPPDDDIPF